MPQNREELRQQINKHPLLSLPIEERSQHTHERLELTQLLLEYKGFDEMLRQDARTRSNRTEDKFWDNYRKKATRTYAFDGIAFTQAAQYAIASYVPDKGATFLTYFNAVYERQLQNAASEKIKQEHRLGIAVSDRKNRLIRNLNRLLEQRFAGDPPAKLPHEICGQLGDVLGISGNEVEELWKLSRLIRTEPLSMEYSMDGETDSPTQNELIADDSAENPLETMTMAARIGELIDAFADLDKREYPRLFLTNDILHPLKEPDESTDTVSYGKLLVQYEEQLFAYVFWKSYLYYVFERPPEPDSIRNLIVAQLLYPLQSKTIAEYKKVTKAAVSQQLAAYRRLIQSYKVID